MQKYLFVLVLILGCSLSSCKDQRPAADPATTGVKADGTASTSDIDLVLSRIQKKVELTPDQIQQVKELHSSYDFPNVSEEDMKSRFREFRDQVMKDILTEEQAAKIKKS